MSKRRNGEGTIYIDKNGATWVQLSRKGGKPGPRRKVPPGIDPVEFQRQLEAEQAAGRDLGRKVGTVKELMDLDRESDANRVRPSTLYYYSNLDRHIISRIGNLKAQDVTLENVQAAANSMYKAGLGADYVSAALWRLSGIYERRPERFPHNPVRWKALRLKRRKRAKRVPLSAYQLRRLLEAADDSERLGGMARYAPAVWLGATLGFRRGEIMGLTWRDVDFKKSEIHVRQQRAARSGKLFSEPKTDASAATVPMGPWLSNRLHDHWVLLQADRRRRGTDWKEHGLVICKEDGSPPRLEVLSDVLAVLEQALRLPHIHPHLLRHSVASLLDELGTSQSVIGDLLRHDDESSNRDGPRMTLTYIRARKARLRKAVEALEAAILAATEADDEDGEVAQ